MAAALWRTVLAQPAGRAGFRPSGWVPTVQEVALSRHYARRGPELIDWGPQKVGLGHVIHGRVPERTTLRPVAYQAPGRSASDGRTGTRAEHGPRRGRRRPVARSRPSPGPRDRARDIRRPGRGPGHDRVEQEPGRRPFGESSANVVSPIDHVVAALVVRAEFDPGVPPAAASRIVPKRAHRPARPPRGSPRGRSRDRRSGRSSRRRTTSGSSACFTQRVSGTTVGSRAARPAGSRKRSRSSAIGLAAHVRVISVVDDVAAARLPIGVRPGRTWGSSR